VNFKFFSGVPKFKKESQGPRIVMNMFKEKGRGEVNMKLGL
jgi:hypothetical protein